MEVPRHVTKLKQKRQRLIAMIHGKVCRKTFVFICVDRRFPDRQLRAMGGGLFWKVYGGVKAQVRNVRSNKHL